MGQRGQAAMPSARGNRARQGLRLGRTSGPPNRAGQTAPVLCNARPTVWPKHETTTKTTTPPTMVGCQGRAFPYKSFKFARRSEPLTPGDILKRCCFCVVRSPVSSPFISTGPGTLQGTSTAASSARPFGHAKRCGRLRACLSTGTEALCASTVRVGWFVGLNSARACARWGVGSGGAGAGGVYM